MAFRRRSSSASNAAINQGARMLGGKHWFAGLLLVVLGVGIYLWQGGPAGQGGSSTQPSSGGQAPPTPRHAEGLPASGRVSYCFDGDSFRMQTAQGEQGVRLWGVDAPEQGQPFGEEARAFAKRTWAGQEVFVASDHGVDQYGRRILEMKLADGRVIQRLLLEAGLAWHYRQYAPDRDDFARAEAEAKAARRGVWSRKQPEPPWEWRKEHRK